MKAPDLFFRAAVAMALAVLAVSVQAVSEDLRSSFAGPPEDCRPMMRWWWFGPAVTRQGLAREMGLMKEGGIGGFEVQPVYALSLNDERKGIRNLPYLSPEFLEALRFTAERAHELGLRMDLTLGSGWPYGGPQVPISEAAARLRVEKIKLAGQSSRLPIPDIPAGESLIAAFPAGGGPELTAIRDGVLTLPGGAARPTEVWFFISGRTGQMVKRAAVGSEGFVHDHLNRVALDHYLRNVGEPMLQALSANLPYAVFCDSLEVYGSDWTGDFLEQFRRRRGYDLRPKLPFLAANLGADTAAIRHDWGRTITELLEERFVAPLREWAASHRTLLRIQGYGVPAAAVSTNRLADLPEGEGHQWKRLSATRWASSASHLYGRQVTSSETWTWLHSPVFRATPLDLKAEADRHFLQGINQLIGHGWPYTAEGVEYPGWRFYASGVFNDKNPWWIVMPDLSLYLQRLSWLLRQGAPINDVALYLPNSDAWARFSPGQVNLFQILGETLGPDLVGRILDAGYGLDFFDDRALMETARVEKGLLVFGGTRYRVVILPRVETIAPEVIRKISEFAQSGGIVLATRRLPSAAPGLMATAADHEAVKDAVRSIFESSTGQGRLVEDDGGLGAAISARLRPDVVISPPASDIGFIHRSTDADQIYFLANTGNTPQSGDATFRIEGLNPEWWDPLSGETRPAAVVSRGAAGVTVTLRLEAYGSRVIVFSRRDPRSQPAPEPTTGKAIELGGGWQVFFGAGGPTVTMDRLRSWTDDETTRYFSGQAEYAKAVSVPEDFLRDDVRIMLDFGEAKPAVVGPAASKTQRMQAELEAPVRESAVVYVNDRRAGSVWCPPYALDVSSLLKPGENRFRIVVANLAVNYMAGRAQPDYRLLNLRYGVKFEPQDMDQIRPVPAGLTGPIRLVAFR
jgi:hypothetical protein